LSRPKVPYIPSLTVLVNLDQPLSDSSCATATTAAAFQNAIGPPSRLTSLSRNNIPRQLHRRRLSFSSPPSSVYELACHAIAPTLPAQRSTSGRLGSSGVVNDRRPLFADLPKSSARQRRDQVRAHLTSRLVRNMPRSASPQSTPRSKPDCSRIIASAVESSTRTTGWLMHEAAGDPQTAAGDDPSPSVPPKDRGNHFPPRHPVCSSSTATVRPLDVQRFSTCGDRRPQVDLPRLCR